MSHLAELRTVIRDEAILRAALAQLGIPVLPGVTNVRSYFAKHGKTMHHADIVLGKVRDYHDYHMGWQLQPDGTYTLIGDAYDVSDKNVLRRLGPSMQQYRMEGEAHVCTGSPTSLLQEYALQVGIYVAYRQGSMYRRAPAPATIHGPDGQEIALPEGTEQIEITGGPIPGHLTLHLVGMPDGTSRFWADGGIGEECYEHMRPFEEELGALLTDTPLTSLETLHQGATQRHIQRA